MRNLILSFSLLVAACGGGNTNAAPADPSTTNATPSSSSTSTSTSTSGGNAGAPEGKCGAGTTVTSATAMDACMADCEKLSDKAPEGSRCLPPKTECKMGCKHKFESAK